MSKWAIAAHVVIVCLSFLMGTLGQASYGLGCFYEKHPFGSACEASAGYWAFAQFLLATAGCFYGAWALGFFGIRLVRRIRT